MARIITARPTVMAAASAVLVGAWILSAGQPGASADRPQSSVPPPAVEPGKAGTANEPAAIAKAREQAKLMHAIYASTLEVMHHHYFRRDRAVLPSRALEEVFADLERQTRVKAKWISVNAKTMNIDHEPASAFEKDAARAIRAGKGEYEMVQDGYYYRAGAIPLANDCVSCHTGFFAKGPQNQRFAGLVISVPVSDK